MFGYRVGFSGTADLMALFSIRTNSRWRPPPSWLISNGHISTTAHDLCDSTAFLSSLFSTKFQISFSCKAVCSFVVKCCCGFTHYTTVGWSLSTLNSNRFSSSTCPRQWRRACTVSHFYRAKHVV